MPVPNGRDPRVSHLRRRRSKSGVTALPGKIGSDGSQSTVHRLAGWGGYRVTDSESRPLPQGWVRP